MSQSRSKSGSHVDKRSPGSAHKSSSLGTRYGDMAGVDMMSPEISIEADGDIGTGGIDVDDEDLNAAFEAEHGSMFIVVDEVRESSGDKKNTASKEKEGEKKKFVIPKVKRPEVEERFDTSYGSGDEGKREWRRNERDARSRDHESGKRDRDIHKSDREERERESRKRDQEDKRERRDSRGERGRQHTEMKKMPQNGRSAEAVQSTKPSNEERQSLFESFAKEGLIAEQQCAVIIDQPAVQQEHRMEGGREKRSTEQAAAKDDSQVPGEEDSALEIPMGRDSLVFVRDYHTWQVRLHPVSKADVTRHEFSQVWSQADSSSIAWSSHKDFGGVAEFLLKDPASVQKFMRKVMWYNFSSEMITVEVTEREKSKMSQQDATDTLDAISNKMTFKFHNARARQLIKTYYPTPQGEVTERSVYVNNVNSGKAVSLLKAVFPCAAKISVARSTRETSTALVETASEEEAFNYLVVYHHIIINNREVLLGTMNNDWEGAKKQYEEKMGAGKKTAVGNKPPVPKTSGPTVPKRPADTPSTTGPAKRGKGPGMRKAEEPVRGRGRASRGEEPVKGRGGPSRGGMSRGRGARGGRGRTLLPDPPIGGGDGLLPLPAPPLPPEGLLGIGGGGEGLLPRPEPIPPPPLMGLPVNPTPKGVMEGELLPPPEQDYGVMELKEIRQELESRVLETRAQLESHLSKLDQTFMPALPPKPRRPVEYMAEEQVPRDVPRRGLLPLDGRVRPERADWPDESADYRRPARPAPPSSAPLERGYDAGASYSRPRREEHYGDVRSARPRPYLLEAPPERPEEHKDTDEREVFDYDHARRRPRAKPELRHEDARPDSRPLLARPALLERESVDRRDYPEGWPYSSRDRYDYEDMDTTRRAPTYRGYEEDSRRVAARYKEDYDRNY